MVKTKRSMKKDKTYYVNIDGEMVRMRASKKPDKSMIDALSSLVKVVRNKFKPNMKGLQISENWSCIYTYEELKRRTEFVFRFKGGLWESAPILKLREPMEEGMNLIQISYDYGGIVNGSVGRFHPQFDGDRIEDISKDVDQFVYDYLIKEKAIYNDKWQPYKPTMI
jgi:hypothetical protein